MHYVYILLSEKDGRTYVGSTNDIERRLIEHNAGRSRATKNRRPLRLLLKETFDTKQEATKRELWWKSGAGRRKLKELFK
ncbi:MAG: GIY-YIG nuclease family protein [Candidatus Peribacteraceae bacterium]|jgi:putative endonuclease|nr:GIY-YIG nuclease family protein [Candidatus Peribacteraceae bacterium]